MNKSYMHAGSDLRIGNCEGVYEPAEDSYLMVDSAKCGKRVLEVGCGTGIVSLHCAAAGSAVDAVDRNSKAVDCTLGNARANGLKVNAFVSDLFSSVPKGERYDTIIFNPPYLPTEDGLPGSEQWDGGMDGFRAVRPFLGDAPGYLADGGEIYIILSSLTDIGSLLSEFKHLKFEKIASASFFFEKIFVWRITS